MWMGEVAASVNFGSGYAIVTFVRATDLARVHFTRTEMKVKRIAKLVEQGFKLIS